MDSASLKTLANSGALDEITNAGDGSAIEQRILMAGNQGGLVKDGVTRSPCCSSSIKLGGMDRRMGFVLRWCWKGRG